MDASRLSLFTFTDILKTDPRGLRQKEAADRHYLVWSGCNVDVFLSVFLHHRLESEVCLPVLQNYHYVTVGKLCGYVGNCAVASVCDRKIEVFF